MKTFFVSLLLLVSFSSVVFAQSAQKEKQFIYVLRLVPRLLDEKNWTESDKQAVSRHFRRLQQLTKDGTVILAGKTMIDGDPDQFGIVVFKAESEEAARKIMEEDDAVKEKIMTARLFPFYVALKS